jgi:nicotinamide-nucleotide amidase
MLAKHLRTYDTMNKDFFEQSQIERVRRSLLKRKETIAVAESVTSGLLQAALAQAECASELYQGGITAY